MGLSDLEVLSERQVPYSDFCFLIPKLVAGAADENVFESGLAYGNCLDLSGKGFDDFRDEAVCAFALHAHLIFQNGSVYVKAGADSFGEQSRIMCRDEQNHVSPDLAFQLRGCAQRHQIAVVHDGEAVAALGLFHEVRGDQHGNVFFVAQGGEVLPEIAAGAGIEAGGWFIEQQHSGMVQQSLGQFDAALHSARERFYKFSGTIREADPGKNFLNALFQRCPPKTIEMSLMPEILAGGEFQVDALRLKDD